MNPVADELKAAIRDVPDFPKKGIIFKDITPLLKDAALFKKAVDALVDQFKDKKIDRVVSVESRGFILGSAIAYKLEASFIPVRKKGKLPHLTYYAEYALEYGTDILEMHQDAIQKGDKVLIIDDLLATGGTLGAAINLVEKMGAEIAGIGFLIELAFLKGREKNKGHEIFSLIKY
ncbi:MAG: adenine phosphoribosyltransferase [Candidatus Omnitrophica bacterium]|nr:adenine phosphoribosyltransferase [Candidatus Omnitrophota bacterium]MBU4488740.1 adenine phosphoribosyltransferase [Candidatus Omnitrophota bacterium]MCG2705837.1 adenine phosphoribosyltransferase [Candidatus Omnitrophota bacterium]